MPHRGSAARRQWLCVLVALVPVVVASAACASGSSVAPAPVVSSFPDVPATPASPTAPPTTVPVPVAELAAEQAITAYLQMWEDFTVTARTSDWRSPRLAQNATGQALSTLSHALYLDHLKGVVSHGRLILNPWVSSVDPPATPAIVVIADCLDSTSWTKYHADNGQLADDAPVGRHQIRAIVTKTADGSWKVTDFSVQQAGTC